MWESTQPWQDAFAQNHGLIENIIISRHRSNQPVIALWPFKRVPVPVISSDRREMLVKNLDVNSIGCCLSVPCTWLCADLVLYWTGMSCKFACLEYLLYRRTAQRKSVLIWCVYDTMNIKLSEDVLLLYNDLAQEIRKRWPILERDKLLERHKGSTWQRSLFHIWQ